MNDVWNRRGLLSPSLISCCDLCNLESCVRTLQSAKADMLHIDILDGHFSPSMPLGIDTVRQLKSRTDLPFDIHLMASRNDFFVGELLDAGADQLVFHAETEPNLDYRLNQIHAAGVRAGIALRPATPLSVLEYVLEKCDVVLLMLINPGYAQCRSEGQVPYAARKVRELHEMICARGLSTKVILDGRISRQDLAAYIPDGFADIFVAGSTCLNKNDLAASAAELVRYRDTLL